LKPFGKRIREVFGQLRQGSRSLKTTLALYFIPISVIPTLSISFYAIRLFEEGTRETLVRRANSEKDAILAEVENLESGFVAQAEGHANQPRVAQALKKRDPKLIHEFIASVRPDLTVRLYAPSGEFIQGRRSFELETQLNYLSREGLKKVRQRGETLERYFSQDAKGWITVIRFAVREKNQFVGVLEEEYYYGQKNLADLKNRRDVDVFITTRDFSTVITSFALSQDSIKAFSSKALPASLLNKTEPLVVTFGDNRYSVFLYDLPGPSGKIRTWGYLALFLSMNAVDGTVSKLKVALVYLSLLLVLTATLTIFVFSNRIVKPVVLLVSAMKRLKSGRVEQISTLDTTYEIEYLVRSFNEMSRNVSAAKRALELKLEELHDANSEIKNTQSTLVQSAKMISLGQIVAGVAHELNNPIAFIYSNMHHLTDYLEKIKSLVANYRRFSQSLPPADQSELKRIEKELEIDFILTDMEDLTRSCLEGANRTKEIVLGLRTFSRMDESTFRLSDLHDGIRSTLKLLGSEFKNRVTIHEELGEIPFIECNLSQLNQVFMNLLSNAAQAIQANGEIWVRTQKSAGETVRIEIEDNGSGIPPEALSKIFDPFYTTKKVGEGTGLGLSIAYGLIQKHHGNIVVTSEVGKGTRFEIILPIRQPVAMTG
jgi:two-component system, NtrC family, sensor kinase